MSVAVDGVAARYINAATKADWTFWRPLRLIGDLYVVQSSSGAPA